MTTPIAPYVCAVCRAPVVAGARFCAQCGTPFADRPPLRVTPPAVPASTPGAEIPPPPPRVPVAPPPPSYGPPPAALPGTSGPSAYTPAPEEPGRAALWVALVVVLFIGALVGAYVFFAEPPAEGDRSGDTVDSFTPEPGGDVPPVTSADEGLDDGSFPSDTFDAPVFTPPDEITDAPEPAPSNDTEAPEPETIPEIEAPPAPDPAPSPRLSAAWNTYRGALGAYDEAVRRAGSSDKAVAEVRAACERLIDAGDAVLRIRGRERYAGQIARDRRDC